MVINMTGINIRAERAGASQGEGPSAGEGIGRQIMDYIRYMREEGKKGETKEAYAAGVYAKARAGHRLTPDEMSFLARTNPALYRKALRVQTLRRALESRLKSCRSRQEADAVFSGALESVSEEDPDRDMILRAYTEAFKEFKESGEYARLPEKKEDIEEKTQKGNLLQICLNSEGYQEAWLTEAAAPAISLQG